MSTERNWPEGVLAVSAEQSAEGVGRDQQSASSPAPVSDSAARMDEVSAQQEDALPKKPCEPFTVDDQQTRTPPLAARRRQGSRRLVRKEEEALARREWTPEQRLLILDSWRRSGLSAGDFAALVGVSKHTLYAWKKAFEAQGPAGLMDQPKGAKAGSRLPELTKRAILMLKETNPDWGCQRISDALLRGPALPASAGAVARVLHEAGYELEEVATTPHPDKVRSFERAQPNQLWQTDLFTFVLKRQNRRVYLVAFMDDHSRFLVSYGLYASQSTALVLEALRAGITAYGPPQEVLSDNGSQYVTWRGAWSRSWAVQCRERSSRNARSSVRTFMARTPASRAPLYCGR